MKEQNNFDPVPTVNTSLYFRHTCQQARLHSCDTLFAENFPKEPEVVGIRVRPCTIPPTHAAQEPPCEGIPQVGLLMEQYIYSSYTNDVKYPSITLIFTQFKPNSIRTNENMFAFPVLWNHAGLEAL